MVVMSMGRGRVNKRDNAFVSFVTSTHQLTEVVLYRYSHVVSNCSTQPTQLSSWGVAIRTVLNSLDS